MNALHPAPQLLRAYAVGDLTDQQAAELEQHLVECPECEQTVDNLAVSDDTLVGGLRQPRPVDPVLDEPQLSDALARFVEQVGLAVDAEPDGRDLGRIGVYQLLEEIGHGGMGTVYKALHTKLKKLVALKRLPVERLRDPHAMSRFEREMEAAGRIEHPHIVRAIDAGEADGTQFLVMEYVPGCDLAELIRRTGPLPIADACELIRQAALGLEAAHQHGLVHRDIKPGNLMLAGSVESSELRVESQNPAASGGSRPSTLVSRPLVKILDLGLARLTELHADADGGLTGTGQIMGTIDYMAPEQASDSHSADIRADIYSLGATLYKLLTGHAPYHGERAQTTMEKLHALATQPVPLIQSRRADVPDELAVIVQRMLEKDPARRYATPAEVAAAIEPLATGADLSALAARALGDAPPATRDPSHTDTQPSAKSASVDTEHPQPSSAPHPASGLASLAATVDMATAEQNAPLVTRSVSEGPAGTSSVSPSQPASADRRPPTASLTRRVTQCGGRVRAAGDVGGLFLWPDLHRQNARRHDRAGV